MKKNILIILCVLFAIYSCEKDDFCTQNPVTPKLIIKFKNYTDITKNKRPSSLYVWANAKDSIYNNASVDSVLLPLNPIANETVYNFSVSNDSISNLKIKYEPKEEFVSRSCGYRLIFNNVVISENSLPKTWIDSISVNQIPTINNQTNAHITIYH